MHRASFAILVISTALSSCASHSTTVSSVPFCLWLNYEPVDAPAIPGVMTVNVEQPPNVLILLDTLHPSFIPEYGHRVVKATIPVDKLYDGANWVEHDGMLEIDWGTGLGGVLIKLRKTDGATFRGSANAYTDVPDPKLQFQSLKVQASRVACGQHGLTIRSSRNRFVPPNT